jgi:hypothetical protein
MMTYGDKNDLWYNLYDVVEKETRALQELYNECGSNGDMGNFQHILFCHFASNLRCNILKMLKTKYALEETDVAIEQKD